MLERVLNNVLTAAAFTSSAGTVHRRHWTAAQETDMPQEQQHVHGNYTASGKSDARGAHTGRRPHPPNKREQHRQTRTHAPSTAPRQTAWRHCGTRHTHAPSLPLHARAEHLPQLAEAMSTCYHLHADTPALKHG